MAVLCYFWGEYTPFEHTDGKLWNYSKTNQLITNFKKGLEKAGQPGWHYKHDAVQQIGKAFSDFWQWDKLHSEGHVALVPIPPSRARTDPLYDDRMTRVLEVIAAETGLPLDIRDCLSFTGALSASHKSQSRASPDELYAQLHFDPETGKAGTTPGLIFLFDDMLTSGAHFVAVSRKLSEVFPGVEIIGIFASRRRVPDPFSELSDDAE